MWILKLRKLVKAAGRDALILFFAVRDPATPKALKLACVAALAYLISPVDLLPDLPLIGWVDDALVFSLGIPYLVKKLPGAVRVRASERADRVVELLGFGRRRKAKTVGTAQARTRPASPARKDDVSDATILSETPAPGAARARPSRG
jgi:uncharacterized membrane protein YkvA (DUF1232 family)